MTRTETFTNNTTISKQNNLGGATMPPSKKGAIKMKKYLVETTRRMAMEDIDIAVYRSEVEPWQYHLKSY